MRKSTKKMVKIIGVVFILVGILLFLIASVGYSSADKAPGIQAPPGSEIVLPENNPARICIQKRAEDFLMFSGLSTGIGILFLVIGTTMGIKPEPIKKPESTEESEKK